MVKGCRLFFVFDHFSLHNISEQLLLLKDRYTVHCVHCCWDFKKNALILAKHCFGEKYLLCSFKQMQKNLIFGVIYEKHIFIVLHEPITMQVGQGMEKFDLWEKTIAARAFGHLCRT